MYVNKLKNYLKNRFKEMRVLDVCLHCIYKLIYYYTCVEIFLETKMEEFAKIKVVQKIARNVRTLKHYYYPVVPPIPQYLFVEDGNQLLIYKGNDQLLSLLEPETYDFIIRNDYRLNKSKWINNKIISQHLDCGDYRVSNTSLLSFIVYHKDQMIDIQLQTESYNYMIVGNIINKKFIYYLLKNMGIKVDDIANFEYHVQLITSNVEVLQMNSTESLRILENDLLIY